MAKVVWGDPNKKYFIQQKNPDGEITLSINTAVQILDMFSFRDRSGCNYEVFMSDSFGKLIHLEYHPNVGGSSNQHDFVNPETDEIVFHGVGEGH